MGEGEQVERESKPPADDRRTSEEYKLRRNTSCIGREVEGRKVRERKTNDRP